MFPSPMLNEPAQEVAVPQMKEYEGKSLDTTNMNQ
jgi:hypothetical protein